MLAPQASLRHVLIGAVICALIVSSCITALFVTFIAHPTNPVEVSCSKWV